MRPDPASCRVAARRAAFAAQRFPTIWWNKETTYFHSRYERLFPDAPMPEFPAQSQPREVMHFGAAKCSGPGVVAGPTRNPPSTIRTANFWRCQWPPTAAHTLRAPRWGLSFFAARRGACRGAEGQDSDENCEVVRCALSRNRLCG